MLSDGRTTMPATRGHPVFVEPSDRTAKIWRYTDFPKYLDLLERGALFFARADLLGDPYEGSVSRANAALRPRVYKQQLPAEALAQLSDFHWFARQWTFINCWHQNDVESAAMWTIYAQTNQAVAIVSTFELLQNVLPSEAFVGLVKYIDYSRDWQPEGNAFYAFTHKRLSFAHEREVRAIIQAIPTSGEHLLPTPTEENGKYVSVELSQLITEVRVAPTAPTWFLDLAQRITARYRLEVPVVRSAIDETPVY